MACRGLFLPVLPCPEPVLLCRGPVRRHRESFASEQSNGRTRDKGCGKRTAIHTKSCAPCSRSPILHPSCPNTPQYLLYVPPDSPQPSRSHPTLHPCGPPPHTFSAFDLAIPSIRTHCHSSLNKHLDSMTLDNYPTSSNNHMPAS